MIKKRIKIVAAAASFVVGISSAQANMFENLVDAANGALPSYGRSDAPGHRTDLSAVEISDAVRELLLIGCNNVVEKLQHYGYRSPSVRIDLPKKWRKARKIAARIGYTSEFDRLERRLEEVAIAVAPATRDLLNDMISEFNIADPVAVFSRGESAATAELRAQVASQLADRLYPIVHRSLEAAGVFQQSDNILRQVRHLPMIKLVDTDITHHVVDQSLDGFFHILAQEERSIRLDPLDQESDLLRRVFG